MKQIPLDAVLAEIDERIQKCTNQREEMIQVGCDTLVGDVTARAGELQCLRDSINSLEVTEVDLDNFIKEEFDKHSFVDSYGQLSVSYNMAEFCRMMKKFIKAQKGE